MKIYLGKMLEKAGNKLIRIGKKVYISPKEKRCIQWFQEEGDKTFRLDYDLNESSIVFDLGGYEGQWASDIFAKYCCFIYVFEPVQAFADKITLRFKSNSKIFIYNFGLSDQTKNCAISIDQDSSSIFVREGNVEKVKLVEAKEFFGDKNIQEVDLMKINIEGGEYDLLEYLIATDLIKSVKNIQVQFHDFMPNAEERMKSIQSRLSKTHKLTWQYPFVWENWQLK